ncbi:uncharacterized protein LOC124141063 isoform X2 [Haliotis rufescens]|uniref:uncharacterized protein LOC124141063 isoform X2 n=1 Tax=Haliotis rufescens TaxID=6454 RepID=UPI001EB05F5B|nr:uncharacterized protein LOC124141063 isoform X2 [Haliotis rufescens]
MDLNESLFSRLNKKPSRPVLSRSLSDSGPEEARDADAESSESGTPHGASYDSLLIPETPSPVFKRCKNKREREVHPSLEEDSDSKRSRAMQKNLDRFISPYKPADIKNRERKEAFEKLRVAREKRLAKIESDSDREDKNPPQSPTNGYKYAHFGTGYLGWPSESESESDDDSIPLRAVLHDKKVMKSSSEVAIDTISDRLKIRNNLVKNPSVGRQMKEAVPSHSVAAVIGPDASYVSEVQVKTEVMSEDKGPPSKTSVTEFVSPKPEGHQTLDTNATEKFDDLVCEDIKQNRVRENRDCEVSEDATLKQLALTRRRNLFPKKDGKKIRPSLFDSCNEPASSINLQRSQSEHRVQGEQEPRPSCRFARNNSFRSPTSLLNDSLGSSNNDSVIMCTPPVHRGDNSAPRTISISESSFLNQLPPGGPKPSNVDRVDNSGNARKNCCYNTNLTFNRPENNVYRTSAEFATPSQTLHVNNTKPNNIIHSIDLTRSDSPTFCSPQSRVNGMHNNCRFQTPTHDVARRETVHIEPTHPISVDVGRPERSPSPDIIPLGVFNLAVNRRPEFDLSITPQPMRNRTGSRRHARASGLRRNRIGNINNSALDDGISPTTTRLMSEVSVSNDADEAVSLVRQMEDDEQYARRLQEEMDKEFAMSLHQADAGFAQSDHAGAFGAEEAACPPALSPTFLQYCRSPVRRRGYNSNRQPVIRRRRGAAAAEPEEVSYEELVVDGPGFEHPMFQHGARRFPPGSDHPLALMEAHILALLDNSPVTRRGRRRGNNGGRFLRNLHSPVGDGNDYEELLELAESLGEVKQKGMTKSELNRLPIRKFKSSDSSGNDTSDCLICMCDYQEGDSLRILPCCHEFHQPCIDKWLKNTATCPICRVDVKNSS